VTVVPLLPTVTVNVPNVLGLGWSGAQREIASRGLRIKPKLDRNDPPPTGVITRQRPRAGTEVSAGAAVHVVIGPG